MSHIYPLELKQFVQQELASGEYQSENELVVDALNMLRELKSRHQALRTEIQRSISQAQRSEIMSLSTEATKSEGRSRLTEQG